MALYSSSVATEGWFAFRFNKGMDPRFGRDTGFAPGFHKLLQRAVGIGQRRTDLKDSTLAQYRADLDRRLDRLLAATPTTEAGRKLAQASANAAAISSFSSPVAMSPPPTTTANGRCGPASSSANACPGEGVVSRKIGVTVRDCAKLSRCCGSVC